MLPRKDLIAAVLSVICWVLTVIVLAEKYSLYSGFGGGCGVFECTWGSTDSDLPYKCNDRIDHIKTTQAFGTMSAIILGVCMLGHVAAAAVPKSLPPTKAFSLLQFVHLVTAAFLTITWTCMVGTYSSKLCDRRISDAPSTAVGYGIFFLCACSATEVVLFLISQKAVKEDPPISTPQDGVHWAGKD
eukprot:TRINITY_DN2434_c0_g1_i1.p1 TRINITY_DN2434_c0_g1~~TRINITY_DN2434_c0_g1_i1.p1  ORF type:complete len:187 (+),score=40.06 TRINITY_DN2434_c0_g1_i1:22-582(+)